MRQHTSMWIARARRPAVALLLAALLAPACQGPPPAGPGRTLVAASIPPLADLAAEIGGERVEVIVLVPPGASPHTLEPSPSQLRRLGRARLLVLNGVGLEYWAEKVAAAADNPDLEVVDTSRRVQVVGGNPHIWLDPGNALLQAEEIRDALVRADPAGRETYEANAAAFAEQVEELDAEIRRRVSGWSRRSFVALHPAWSYLAARYGLDQAAVLEESPGHEPSAAEMVAIVEAGRRAGAGAVLAEPQLPSKSAQVLAEEAGVPVLVLDPLGGGEGKGGYRALMTGIVDELEGALR
jgi:zinc transport system substrate-binding protein